jgi:hypothetical protein
MYIDEQGIQYSDDRKVLILVPEDFHGELIIPEGVTNIDLNAFNGCHNITGVSMPDSLRKEINESEFSTGYVALINKALDAAAGYYNEDDIASEDMMEETIEGEGEVRHISYYIADTHVTLDLHVWESGLMIWRAEVNVDGGFADSFFVPEIPQLMNVLNVSTTKDIIDALMEQCKSDFCSFDMKEFSDFLHANHLQCTQKQRGIYQMEMDENGHSQFRFVPPSNN